MPPSMSVVAPQEASLLEEEEGEVGGDEIEPFAVLDRGIVMSELERKEDVDAAGDKWKDINTPSSATATIGVAAHQAWEQAKKEFEFIRNKLEAKCGTRRPKFPELFDLIFGENGSIFHLFHQESLFPNYEEFSRFIATFFLSSSYQVSTKQLFHKHSRISLDGAMTQAEYVAAWNRIGNKSLPSTQERNRHITPSGLVPFWMKLERVMNELTRELFIEGFPGEMQVTLDDDKAHCSANQYTAGLKVVRHVKDNVPGHTLHTLVLSYSQIPIQLAWERELNDSAVIATKRIFGNGIAPMAAPGEAADLGHISGGQDRGYWNHDLIHDYYMRSGADIEAATTKRQSSIPFTYKQKLSKKDTRTDVPACGPKTMYMKEITSHGRKLYSIAYRNNKKVTLGLSTVHGATPTWEMVVKRPQDLQWYEETLSDNDRIRKSFHELRLRFSESPNDTNLYVDMDESFLLEIAGLSVRALTTTQGTPEWFMLRRFSLTSSTTDRAIAACEGTESWLENAASWQTVKDTLKGIVGRDDDSDEDRDGDEEDYDSDESSKEGNNDNEERTRNNNEADASVKLTLENLLQNEGLIETARHQIQFEEYKIDEIREVLKALGKPLSKAKKTEVKEANDLKNFRVFLDAEPRLRKYIFKTKKELSTIASQLGIDKEDLTGSQDDIRTKIEQYLQANPDAYIKEKPKSKAAKKKAELSSLSPKARLLHAVLSSGFLDPLKGANRKYTRRGHQLECHIMRACIDELKDNDDSGSPVNFIRACAAPLVEKSSERYVRGSIDFLALATAVDDDGIDDDFVVGVEVKSRVAHRRDQEATAQAATIRALLGQDKTPRQRKKKYFVVRADSLHFPKIVDSTHEAIQVLHHAHVYDLDYVLLLVGDNRGEVIYGIFVNVPTEIRQSYGGILSDIYKQTLEWIYNEESREPDDLEAVLGLIEVAGDAIDRYCFTMDVSLWRDINNNFTFPIPRLKHIIPLIFAIWNSLKGGSDATTLLIWHCQYCVPNRSNQSVAVARMLSLLAVHVHRLSQIASAKIDLDFYSCLKAFRDAATQRSSFKSTQFNIINHITKDATSPSTPPPPARVAAPIPVAVAQARRSQANIERLTLPMAQTNKTPKRSVLEKVQKLDEKLKSGKLDASSKFVLERTRTCTGFPIKRIAADGSTNGKGGRGTCAKCRADTHSYCLKCKFFFCDTPTAKARALPGWKDHIIINPQSDNPIHAQRTCFLDKHIGCIMEELTQTVDDYQKCMR